MTRYIVVLAVQQTFRGVHAPVCILPLTPLGITPACLSPLHATPPYPTSPLRPAPCRRGQRLHIINCNQHTEVSDFLGGFRPNRHRERSLVQLQAALAALNASPLLAAAGQAALPPPPTPTGPDLQAAVAGAQQRLAAAAAHVKGSPARGRAAKAAAAQLEQLRASVAALAEAAAGVRAPFEWADGPLVQAMKCGDMILVDELNLAEDAVLERLNRWGGVGGPIPLGHLLFEDGAHQQEDRVWAWQSAWYLCPD